MTFSVAELQLLAEALTRAANRCDTYARIGRGDSKKFADKARQMQQLRERLSNFRARHELVEVA